MLNHVINQADIIKQAGKPVLWLITFLATFLVSVGQVQAVANISLTPTFTSADAGRAGYMDSGGVWNGSAEVTNSTGDRFNLQVVNSGAASPADDAIDVNDIRISMTADFVLSSSTVNVTASGGCPAIAASANQPGGAGNDIIINIPNNTDIPAGCTYDFEFGLSTTDSAPFVAAGNHTLTYDFTYDSPAGSTNTVSQNQTVAVRTGSLAITKSTAATSATSGDTISYSVTVTSNGTGGLFDVILTDTVSADLTNVTITPISPVPPGSGAGPGGNQYTLSYLDPGQSIDFTVTADVVVTTTGTCPILNNTASVTDRTTTPTQVSAPVVSVPYEYTPAALSGTLSHDLTANVFTSNSYCELCGDGIVRIVLENPLEVAMTNIVVTEHLLATGLTYISGSTVYYLDAGGPNAGGDPTIAGTDLIWNSTDIPELASLAGSVNPAPNRQIVIEFGVRRLDEGLISAVRDIQAEATFDLSCSAASHNVSTGIDTLPLREPIPSVSKTGRNVDAGQSSYSNPVYGNINDDVLWRIDIANGGLAAMQDLIFDDLMTAGNMNINYACPTETSALAVANNNGVLPGGSPCIASSNSISNFVVDDPFGNPGNDEPATFLDVPAQGNAQIYLVGKLTSSCNNQTNTVDGVEWGCEVNSPPEGGITATSTGAPAGTSTATMSTLVVNGGLNIQREIIGTNTGQPLGSRGTVRLTITNNSGGTVKNIKLRDVLPIDYVVDPTFTPTLAVTHPGGYADYPGMIDVITWDNPAANTFPLTSSNPAEPLANTAPEFSLISAGGPSTPDIHPIYADQFNMLRHGDVAVVEFQIVMINSNYFDKIADLDVREEITTDSTDPLQNPFTVSNDLYVTFEQFCDPGVQQNANYLGDTFTADPEDLDIDIFGTELTFILTNDPAQSLPLRVDVTNRGGHDANNYFVYVTFGTTMEVLPASVPAECSLTGNPPLLEVWDDPADIPATAAVYQCTAPPNAVIGPGNTVSYNFEVIKTSDAARIAADDLSFRADVIGEVTLNDGTPLWFPEVSTTTTVPAAQIDNRANNYSLDAIRARVLGFNLTKNRFGDCSENNPPTAGLEANVEIAEECTFRIRTGGWFGFQTPGFTLIQVQNVQVVDELPDGQGYISSTDPALTSDPTIQGISLNPAGLSPLDEGWIDWTFNQVAPINIRDQWFQADAVTRILNDPVDTSAAPNVHAALSTNVLNSTFDAVFQTGTDPPQLYNLGPSTVGYPDPPLRTVDLTVTEPNLLVTKEVCNESLNGTGATCSTFVTLANNGDTNDSYVYRIRIENEASAGSVTRAPAYNVISTDTLDSSDLMLVVPFNTDGLDNDGDGLIDGADTDGEGSISDNIVNNATPAVITFSTTHSTRLQKINPGEVFYLYYRVDPDDAIAPLQTLTNTVSMTYDSQNGDFGNQTVVQRPNSDIGGGRVYNTTPAQANVQIINLVANQKGIMNLSNTTMGGVAPFIGPQNVSIGEEVEYQLNVLIPVSHLRNFVIRDELPAGISCIEAPVVDLNAAPYSTAGFVPGGQITPTCTNNLVEWNFGDQELTLGSDTRFDFKVGFIARVDNIAANIDGLTIRNGGTGAGSTVVTTTYVNEVGATITLNHDYADVTVREPQIALTKAFAVPNSDAADVLTVTVTATNTGTAAAYNLRVLDDLAAVANLTYLGNVGGTDPPDNVTFLAGDTNRPIFSWNSTNPDNEIPVSAVRSFTFDVRVEIGAQPLEVLDNTIQASWTSLPGQTTALNSSGLIGADGSATGMRNGALPNAGDPLNDYETTASASTSVLPLTMNKTDLDNTVVPTIGAHKNFQIEINLPEGTTNNLVATDDLVTTGLSYVLSNNALFDITYTFDGIATINGQPPSEAVFNAFPADNTANTATWDIGTVVTSSEDDSTVNAINPVIRINYYARVNNDLVTDSGDTLQNGVDVTYRNGETAATETLSDNTPLVTVLEPLLSATKTVTNETLGKAQTDPPVGGDILEYVVTVNNTGNATAFDVNLVDTIAAETQLYPAFTPTALINGVAVVGFVATPAGANAGPLVWGRDNGDGSLDIPAGQSLVLTYRVQVQPVLTPGTVLSNSVLIDWTSLDDVSTYERTGAGCPTITAPDDYCIGPITAVTTSDPPSLVIQKTVINTSTGQDPGKNASPGDTLRYTITVTNTGTNPVPVLSVTDEVDRLTTLPVLFEAGTMSIIAVPVGADTTNTDVNGGTNGTGLLDVRNLSLDATGGANDSLTIVFDVTLAPVITSGTVVLNQAQVHIPNLTPFDSDDPTVNGVDNPAILGDEDPTETTITSAPQFRVQKISQDITGDPAVLEAGDTLRYTITVENYGNENSINTILNDAIPVNTSYVANSTTLNGTAVADPSAGVSAIESGMLINAPVDTTPGLMPADANGTLTLDNVATITFDVVVSPSAINGTIISNQGYVNGDGAGSGAFPQQPSDDPGTPTVPDDPTIDVVGNVPLIDVQKTVAIQIDNGTAGILDPLDTIRYTITIRNIGAQPATGVMLTDNIPADTTYVANSVMLNGVNIPDVGGVSPLVAGSYVRSSDLPALPLPISDPADAIISSLQSAVVTFDVQVNAGTATGTIIRNQGLVTSNELLAEPTDWDGDDSNGDQPTDIVVGNAQQLSIVKSVSVVGGGPALAGGQLEYLVRVTNIGAVPASNVVITDDLDVPVAGQMTYVAGSGLLNGLAAGVSYAAPVLTADYSTTYGDLAPGNTATLRFRVLLNAGLAIGTTVTNTAQVYWDAGSKNASDSVSIDIGGTPGVATLNGTVWHDADFDNILDSGERLLAGWFVDVYRNSILLGSVQTDSNGVYRIVGLSPYVSGNGYELKFRQPGAGSNTALLGLADSIFTNNLQQIQDIFASSGSNLQNLNLPIDPNGVVYNSLLRTTVVPGATLTMLRASTGVALPANCFDDTAQQGQVTLALGYYKFDINFSQPECPSGSDYIIQVVEPASGYNAAPSILIPPQAGTFDVPTCTADAIPATANACEVQVSEFAPGGAASTTYYLRLTLDNSVPVPKGRQLFNNHIPLDPLVGSSVAISKTSALLNVTRAQLVPYTITVRNTFPSPLNLNIVDNFPAGFKYVQGSAQIDGIKAEPVINGQQMRWNNFSLALDQTRVIKMLLVVSSGVSEGEYVNSVFAENNLTAGDRSGTATATVRVVPDPTFDCSDVIGKVFDDKNMNGYQDEGEKGLPGVRVATARGLLVKTDKHGRFHITCAVVPDEGRGSNFIMKLDPRTLPTGYRITTENPRVQRATRGKMLKYNFGATVHRVVKLDLADGVFMKDSAEMRLQWTSRLDLLLEELKKQTSILRLSYLADIEDEDLVDERIETVKDIIEQRWQELNCCYSLTIESEVFWRRGGPVDGGDFE